MPYLGHIKGPTHFLNSLPLNAFVCPGDFKIWLIENLSKEITDYSVTEKIQILMCKSYASCSFPPKFCYYIVLDIKQIYACL